jgi:hypothetical protein
MAADRARACRSLCFWTPATTSNQASARDRSDHPSVQRVGGRSTFILGGPSKRRTDYRALGRLGHVKADLAGKVDDPDLASADGEVEGALLVHFSG